MKRRVTGALLVGGLSRRMGTDKTDLCWNGRPLHCVLLGRLSRAFDSRPMLVCRGNQDLEVDDAVVVRDLHSGLGVMGGLHAALTHAQTDWVFLAGCDMPGLSRALLTAMASHPCTAVDALVPRAAGRLQPLHALYHRDALPSLKTTITNQKLALRGWLETIRKVDLLES